MMNVSYAATMLQKHPVLCGVDKFHYLGEALTKIYAVITRIKSPEHR
jgi:hypothetical protein